MRPFSKPDSIASRKKGVLTGISIALADMDCILLPNGDDTSSCMTTSSTIALHLSVMRLITSLQSSREDSGRLSICYHLSIQASPSSLHDSAPLQVVQQRREARRQRALKQAHNTPGAKCLSSRKKEDIICLCVSEISPWSFRL